MGTVPLQHRTHPQESGGGVGEVLPEEGDEFVRGDEIANTTAPWSILFA